MDSYRYGENDDSIIQPLRFAGERPYRDKPFNMTKKKFAALMFFGALAALIIGILIGQSTNSNTPGAEDHNDPGLPKQNVTKFLFSEMKADNIKENLRILSEKVHIAGSMQEENYLVDFLSGKWKEQLDEANIYPYDVLLSYPNGTDPNYVAVLDAENRTYDVSSFFEPSLTRSENFSHIQSTFNAYGAAGHVEGDLVFVNYGRMQDFEQLNKTFKIDTNGKICIAKYGKLFRADKALHAEKFGCLGLIVYTDPADYGDRNNISLPTFPETWWMPHTGIQRGTMYIENGDPTTPFYPSINSSYRVPEKERVLPHIPIQPISSDDALKYLSKIGGPEASKEWKGGLNITYRIGGEMLPKYRHQRFLLHVANYRPIKTIKNVVGYIWGAVEPDRHIILGNHRDAWVFGAVDPSSGTAVMMEIARAMGVLVKSGKWRPRRTIVFCSWGAEEYGLIGSSEWVEQFEKKLLLEAVAYLNVDIAVQGTTTFRARAMPNLHGLLFDAAKAVVNPDSNEIAENRPTVYDTWRQKYADKDDKDRPWVGTLGSGSDYLAFVQKTGISSVDMRYTFDEINLKLSSYPLYHSAHETIEYFEKFLDPEYRFSLAVAQLWAELSLRLADDVVIPFDVVGYADAIKGMVSAISEANEKKLKERGIKLDYLLEAADELVKSSKKLNDTIVSINKTSLLEVRQLNDKLMYLDRAFLDFNGLPGRRQLRHVVYAPSRHDSYLGTGFSGLLDAIQDAEVDSNWEIVKQQLSIITFHLLSAASVLVPF